MLPKTKANPSVLLLENVPLLFSRVLGASRILPSSGPTLFKRANWTPFYSELRLFAVGCVELDKMMLNK